MTYDDILQVDGRFQSSINIQYDIGNIHKIDCYVPTQQSVRVLGQYLSAIYYDRKSDYASVLVGPYGKGKSHLMLILLSILASDAIYEEEEKKKACRAALDRLIARIERVDVDTAALAREILLHKKPMLPVIVDSNASEINQVLILALRNALDRCGCSKLLPELNFDVALEMISRWESSYPEAFERLQTQLLPYKYNVRELRDALGTYSRSAYDIFCEVYPSVTSGSIFAPIFAEGALPLYTSVSHSLIEQTAFGGMFIVYDEFSKFLEANLDKSAMLNFKVVQELAEMAARSSEAVINFTCITHKDLLNYSDNDSFRTVVGRFKQIEYVQSSEQSYELIANAIEKKDGYADFLRQNAPTFESAWTQVTAAGLFERMENTAVLRDCFPLAPLTACALLRISEKVAQNERTLFTFLASRVMDFIKLNHDGVEFMTVDTVFDYFAPSFASEVFNEGVHSQWRKATAALQQSENEVQMRIIKALAIILITDDEQIRPNAMTLKAALLLPDDVFMREINRLCALQLLTKREVLGEYAFLTANGADVKNSVRNYVAAKLPSIQLCTELQRFVGADYVLPRQYNSRHKMIRFFKRMFMDTALFCAYDSGATIVQGEGADGVIIQIVANNDAERCRVLEHMHHMKDMDCVLIAVNDADFALEEKLKELLALQALQQSDSASADGNYAQELMLYEEDVLRYVRNTVSMSYSASNAACRYYYRGQWLETLTKPRFLSRHVSEICESVYCTTPEINNEMINKSSLTAPIRKARMAVINRILSLQEGEEATWDGNGPDASIGRTLIENKQPDGLRCESDASLEAVLRCIDGFVRSAIGVKRDMAELYDTLCGAPFGLRRGVLPVYIAWVLHCIDGGASFYRGEREFLLSAGVLDNVDATPTEYALFIDEATQEKETYIAVLCDCFKIVATHTDQRSALVAAMQRSVRGLPRVTRDARHEYRFDGQKWFEIAVPQSTIAFCRQLQGYDVNVRELLMEGLPDGRSYAETAADIQNITTYLGGFVDRLKHTLIDYAKSCFAPDYEGSLSQAIGLWREKQDEAALKRLYDAATNRLLRYVLSLDTYDDVDIISHIALLVTGIAIEDWNDLSIPDFADRLKKAIAEIESTQATGHGAGFSVTIVRDGESYEKRVADGEISQIGKTLMNNLRYSIDEYGDAVSPEEKVAILARMIQEITGDA